MLHSLLKKLIKNQSGTIRMATARIGLAVAVFLLLIAVQIQSNYHFLLESPNNKDSIADFLVINKVLDNDNLGNSELDSNLIKEIAKQPFTESVGLLNPSRFKASIQSISNQFPFYTDISFESVPSSFIDIKNAEFAWNPTATFVPVIVPNMFLDIYNFQFSLSQNLPQLTPAIVKMIVFKLTVYGKNGPISFNAKIVGLSDRISSMLVPTEFIEWGNNYAEKKSGENVSRLVLKTSDPSNPAIATFLKKNNLSTNTEKLRYSKYRKVIDTVVSISGIAGGIMLVFALIIFTLFIQLTIANCRPEIILLITLGATPNQLSKFLIKQFYPGNIKSILLATLLVVVFQLGLKILLEQQLIYISPMISWYTLVIAILLALLLWIVTYKAIQKHMES
ncbi:FtsX-like permease family protein [Sediminibacterium sp.]|uniref:FtsX-like permease family protein n=1 Tax=Sediminibacterium sp. TaxID=1917865 RepID=UPI003F722BFB